VQQPIISTPVDVLPDLTTDFERSVLRNPSPVNELTSYFERPVPTQEPSIDDRRNPPANRSRSFPSFSKSIRKWHLEMAAGKR
jgi:hypothetical protein